MLFWAALKRKGYSCACGLGLSAVSQQKSIQQAGVLFDTFETLDGDSTGMSNSYVDFLQENMNEINYKPRGSKKKD